METKAVIFDLWNTLAYTKGAKSNPIVKLEEMLGLNMGLYREVEQGMMKKDFRTKRDAMISLCRHIGVKPKGMLVDSLVYVWENTAMNVTLFPDVVQTLQKLGKGFRLGLLSNTDCFTVSKFNELGFNDYFNSVAFSCKLGLLKPDPRIFNLILHDLGVKPEEAVMVGDNYKDDILAAERLGIRGVLMKRDYAKYRVKPLYIESHDHSRTISSLAELEKFL